jgi:uncharacterized DUF497 family protein
MYDCAYHGIVQVEWDSFKAVANLKKHRIDFADAATVLYDEMAITMLDDFVDEEERFISVGTDALGRLLTVVFTWRGDSVRLISAREATRRERRDYEGKR